MAVGLSAGSNSAVSGSHAPQRLSRGHAGGADGGQQSGDGADDEGGGEPAGPGEGRDDGGPVFGVGVDGGRSRAEPDTYGAAQQREQHRFGEELDADVSLGGAERAAEPDFGAAFEHADEHDVADADGADEQGDRAEAKEQAVERAFGVGAGD